MAKLSANKRKAMPKSDFALPSKKTKDNKAGKGAYPIEDRAHARNALARVAQKGTAAEKASVAAKVRAKYPDIGAKDRHKEAMRKSVRVETMKGN